MSRGCLQEVENVSGLWVVLASSNRQFKKRKVQTLETAQEKRTSMKEQHYQVKLYPFTCTCEVHVLSRLKLLTEHLSPFYSLSEISCWRATTGKQRLL